MFQGNGHQIHNSTFYNVGGDVNLETHHYLTPQHHWHGPYAPTHQLQSGILGIQGDLTVESHQRLTNQEAFQPPPGSTFGFRQTRGSRDSEWTPVVRNPHNMKARSAPYAIAGRQRSSVNTNGAHTGKSSLSSFNSVSRSSGEWHGAIPRPEYGLIDSPSHRDLPPSVHGGSFFTANNVTVNHNQRNGEGGIKILHRAVALEALYDSADSFPQPRCHPETRTEMLDTLYKWAVQHDSARPVRWLHGPAGAGKSAIMQTLCLKLQAAGRLGGAFFFKRSHTTRGNAKVLFATLAYQLALNNRKSNPTIWHAISQSAEDDPSVVGRSMDAQLCQLIVEPCHSFIGCPPIILLIDGLDECQDEDAQREIIRSIGSVAAIHRHLRFLIASRPEAHIREVFEDRSLNGIRDSINVQQSFEDIRTYFRDEFARIHREHATMVNVSVPWPPSEILEDLVDKSSGFFVYASTVIKFIDDKYHRPTERLAAVRNLSPSESHTPFEALDQLYIQILSGVPTRFRSILGDILQCALVFKFDLTAVQYDRLLGLERGDVELILRGLHSVLTHSRSGTIHVHHASFLDFLQDQRRSSSFHFNMDNRMNVARAVLKALSDDNHWLENPDDPLAWCLGADHVIQCITLIPPSAELVPLIQGLNPDFLWGKDVPYGFENQIQKVLAWLNQVQPVPKDLIRRWEDYNFMFLWDTSHDPVYCKFMKQEHIGRVLSLSPQMLRVLQTKMSRFLLVSVADCRRFLARFPGFARIFQARWLLYSHLYQPYMQRRHQPNLPSLYRLRLIFDVSWDDITAALSAVRLMVGGGSHKRVVAGTIAILAILLELYPTNIPNLISDLGCRMLRLIHRRIGAVESAQCPQNYFTTYGHYEWGTLISPEDCYNVLRWLEALPDPPLELIGRWERYFTTSQGLSGYTLEADEDRFERRWLRKSEWMMLWSTRDYSTFNEGILVIQHWERLVEEISRE
ncbi:NACHT domain-containing protein [Mycena venus]|uniref:NACHT domain-containing protein n=1 Tax=Mycena venus TaxID=2733690 RepID=A0A8H6WUM2_9AGAR|nr:NACHT domain-containing protein [Mycena venus]